jgi:hypothetical protein
MHFTEYNRLLIKSRRKRWAGHVACMGLMRHAYRILVIKLEGKKAFGRPKSRWEANVKMELMEVKRECENWIHLY